VTGLAIAFALLSATTVAFSTSVQHQAAEMAPSSVTGTWALLGHLARRPLWLIGQLLGTVALVMHALALSFGPIALVQPLVISGVVLAVPARAAISRRLPGAREVVAVLIAASGLAVFLVVSAPSAGAPAGLGPLPLLMVVGCMGLAVAGIALAPRIGDPTLRAFLLGSAAGILFALVAVLLKMSLDELAAGGLGAVVTTWPIYVLVMAGLGGVLCNQLAYRSARLSSSMPVLNVVDCLLALVFGYVVFHEVPRHSPGVAVVEGLALVAMLAGLWILARDAAADLAAEADGQVSRPSSSVSGDRQAPRSMQERI
jgi:drug/metabolite transporter (DMT)-like permease